ncbi:hypothetical protein K474DRAFT_1378953 [Panus rudis PR-1116 ss-1]|nr:hypothetical protein K474DRAFT_1378953 [Panus rudis PR-1116 ss-1]
MTQVLPTELFLKVFALACTDDGRTGCSLLSTSHYIRALCLETGLDIQTIHLLTAPSLRKFLSSLNHRKKDARRLRFLYLDLELQDVTVGEKGTPIREDVEELLRSINPSSLRVLTIVLQKQWSTYSDHARVPSLLPVMFSSLRELTIYDPECGPSSYVSLSPAPGLLRLHIACCHALPHSLDQFLRAFSPNLRYLRLSMQTPEGACNLVNDLRRYIRPRNAAVPNDSRESVEEIDTDVFPPSLHCIDISVLPLIRSLWESGARRFGLDQFVSSIRDLSYHSELSETPRKLLLRSSPRMLSQAEAIRFRETLRTEILHEFNSIVGAS